MYNEFVAEQADNVVHMFGDFLLSILKDPDAPAVTHRIIERNLANVWPDIRDRLKWDLAGSLQLMDNETAFFRALRLRHWAAAPPTLFPPSARLPQPFTALTARLRHALFPAEQTPPGLVIWGWMLLNISSAGEACNWAVAFHFWIIDRTDEGQVALDFLNPASPEPLPKAYNTSTRGIG